MIEATRPRDMISDIFNLKRLLNINIILNFVSSRVKGESLIISESNPGNVSVGVMMEENMRNNNDRDIEAIRADS